jgi:hypothetical protein
VELDGWWHLGLDSVANMSWDKHHCWLQKNYILVITLLFCWNVISGKITSLGLNRGPHYWKWGRRVGKGVSYPPLVLRSMFVASSGSQLAGPVTWKQSQHRFPRIRSTYSGISAGGPWCVEATRACVHLSPMLFPRIPPVTASSQHRGRSSIERLHLTVSIVCLYTGIPLPPLSEVTLSSHHF